MSDIQNVSLNRYLKKKQQQTNKLLKEEKTVGHTVIKILFFISVAVAIHLRSSI